MKGKPQPSRLTALEPLWRLTAPEGATIAWRPNPGRDGRSNPQELALASQADEIFYGGAKGGAKTDTIVARPLRQVHRSAYAAAFVRSTFRDLARPLDRMKAIYERLPANQRPIWRGGKDMRWTFPSGAIIQLGYTESGLNWAQGGGWSEVLWDEMGNEADEGILNSLVSEIRCPDPEVVTGLMGTGNPGFAGHPWTKRRYVTPCGKRGEKIAWQQVELPDGSLGWRSRQFIPSRVTDNPTYANDRAYMTALALLPERMRRCLLDGDYDAATGMALDEVDEAADFHPHLIRPFDIPAHWPYISSFDWGFVHPAVYIWGRVSDDGRIYICDTVKRRLMRDWDLAGAFEELVPIGARVNVQSGGDVKNEVKAREEQQSTRTTFAERGIHLAIADASRVHGYKNMLTYLAWKGSDYVQQRDPMVKFFDTPTNRWGLQQLTQMVNDPDDPRDVLKVNANVETGDGGDDFYDCLRYLLASRAIVAKSGIEQLGGDAFSPEILRAEAARAAKGTSKPMRKKRRNYF